MVSVPKYFANENQIEGQMNVDLLLLQANKHIRKRKGTIRMETRASATEPLTYLANRTFRVDALMPWLSEGQEVGFRTFDDCMRDFHSIRVAFTQVEMVSEVK